jgi:flavin-dependent dehydrogenase
VLAAVGLGNVPLRLGAVPLRRALLAAPRCRAELPLPGGIVLSREALDASLVEAAIDAGAAFLPRTHAALSPLLSDERELLLSHDGRTVPVTASLVLAATGLGGRLLAGEHLAAPATRDSRIGAGAIADEAPASLAAGCVNLACGPGGYVGLARLEDGRLDVAAALDREAVRRAGGPGHAAGRILAEAGLPAVARLADLAWRGTPPLTRRVPRPWGERLLVLGDAAGYVEPFTGEGIAWALSAAVAVAPLAARAALRWDASVGRAWMDLYRRVVADRQTQCRLVARAMRHPALTRAAIGLLGLWPRLANPIVNRLNAAADEGMPS